MPCQTSQIHVLQKYWNASFMFLMFNWFWRNAVPNMSCFPLFCMFCAGSTIEHIWVFTCLYFPKYVLEFCTKYMNGNYVLNNMLGTYFQKICWCEYVLEMSYSRVSSRNNFGIYLYVHIFPNIFSMKHFGTYFKKGFGNTMPPVRCCKNPY